MKTILVLNFNTINVPSVFMVQLQTTCFKNGKDNIYLENE